MTYKHCCSTTVGKTKSSIFFLFSHLVVCFGVKLEYIKA